MTLPLPQMKMPVKRLDFIDNRIQSMMGLSVSVTVTGSLDRNIARLKVQYLVVSGRACVCNNNVSPWGHMPD